MKRDHDDRSRADRLAAALRDNLRRRKAQGRSQSSTADARDDEIADGKSR